MKLCENYRLDMKKAERAPTAVPFGLFMMGLLVMTFESPVTVVFGLFLAAWGATSLLMRAAELACCIRFRREKLARGEETPPCLTA